LTDELRAAPPALHGAGEFWGLHWPALAWLERELRSGQATLETGAGASTLVFAAAGTEHEAVTPVEAEREEILAECKRRGIPIDRVTFHIGPSQEVLPHLEPSPLDLVLIDGAHGFPYPILDWWFLAPRLRIGGLLVVDDCYFPPVGAVVDFLRAQPSWELAALPGRRTVVFSKLAEAEPSADWSSGGRMSFRYLPPLRRLRGAIEHRVLESRPLRALAARQRASRSGGSTRQTT
jgi:Methyltransferase domain